MLSNLDSLAHWFQSFSAVLYELCVFLVTAWFAACTNPFTSSAGTDGKLAALYGPLAPYFSVLGAAIGDMTEQKCFNLILFL